MVDPLKDRYQDLLDGSYDCVDRIVLNAYFPLGSQSRRLSSWVASALWLGRPSGQHPSETHGGSVQPAAVRLREEASTSRGALRARGTQT